MRASKSKEIDGLSFTVQQLPGKRGSRLWFKLVRLLAPAMAKALGTLKLTGGASALMQNLDLSNLGDAVGMLAEKLTPDEFEAIRDELLESATVTTGGNQFPLMTVYDDVMAGRVTTGLKVLQFAFEVNFGSFFEGFLAEVGKAAGKALKSEG